MDETKEASGEVVSAERDAVSVVIPVAEMEMETAATSVPALETSAAHWCTTLLKVLFLKYLGRIGAKWRAKQNDNLQKKKDVIITYAGVHGRITHKEAM